MSSVSESSPPSLQPLDEASKSSAIRLTGSDFDAYAPARASSNAFTRPRLELKQRMLGWARSVQSRMSDLSITLDVSASDEHPNVRNGRKVDCQRVFFWRDAASRMDLERLIDHKRTLAATLGDPAPHKSHIYLGLKVDDAGVAVTIELHPEAWVDVQNLSARLANVMGALELTTALEALPEQFLIGLAGDAEKRPADKVTAFDLRELVDRSAVSHSPLWLGWSVSREVALLHSLLLDEQLEDAIVALGPVYKLIAWAEDNDHLQLDREWDAARADLAKTHEEAEHDRAQWEQRRDAERWQRNKEREDREAIRLGEGGVPRAVARERDEKPGATAPAPLPRRDVPSPRKVARKPVVTEQDPTAAIDKGVKVEVLHGPFAGKVGVVQELDGRGGVRIMLGLLALRVEMKDIVGVTEGPERPAFSSSHRRPGAK